MPGPQALRIQQQTTLTQSSYSSIRGAQPILRSLLSFIHSHLGWSLRKGVKMGLPANGQHHRVVLESPEQAPFPQCRQNLFPGHKSVKTLGKSSNRKA